MFIGRTDVEAETPTLWLPDSFEKTLMLGKIEGKRSREEKTRRKCKGRSVISQRRRGEERKWSFTHIFIQRVYLALAVSHTVLGPGNTAQTEAQLFWVHTAGDVLLMLCAVWLVPAWT